MIILCKERTTFAGFRNESMRRLGNVYVEDPETNDMCLLENYESNQLLELDELYIEDSETGDMINIINFIEREEKV